MNYTGMTKDELLEQVARLSHVSNCSGNLTNYSVELAKIVKSDEECRNQQRQVVKQAEKFEKSSTWVIGTILLIVFIASSVFTFYNNKPDTTASVTAVMGNVFSSGLVGITAAVVILVFSIASKIDAVESRGYSRTIHLLLPVSGTRYCEQGAAALKDGGDLPAQWRNLALKERSQLYIFDVLIMTALADQERMRAAAHSREQACRSLRDLPSSA